jgi:hypothetical protein
MSRAAHGRPRCARPACRLAALGGSSETAKQFRMTDHPKGIQITYASYKWSACLSLEIAQQLSDRIRHSPHGLKHLCVCLRRCAPHMIGLASSAGLPPRCAWRQFRDSRVIFSKFSLYSVPQGQINLVFTAYPDTKFSTGTGTAPMDSATVDQQNRSEWERTSKRHADNLCAS